MMTRWFVIVALIVFISGCQSVDDATTCNATSTTDPVEREREFAACTSVVQDSNDRISMFIAVFAIIAILGIGIAIICDRMPNDAAQDIIDRVRAEQEIALQVARREIEQSQRTVDPTRPVRRLRTNHRG